MKWKRTEIWAKMLKRPEIQTFMSNFSDRNMHTLMTKKLVDFGFSSPKISPVNVCESGQQNLRPNVHKS